MELGAGANFHRTGCPLSALSTAIGAMHRMRSESHRAKQVARLEHDCHEAGFTHGVSRLVVVTPLTQALTTPSPLASPIIHLSSR